MSLDPETLDQLVQIAAESAEIPNWKDAHATPEVLKLAAKYEDRLLTVLQAVVKKWPPRNGASALDLYEAEAPFLVLMTLRGEGVGIWDGSWDDFYSQTALRSVQSYLKHNLGSYADDTGAGKLEEAFMEAAYETTGTDEEEELARNPSGVVVSDYDTAVKDKALLPRPLSARYVRELKQRIGRGTKIVVVESRTTWPRGWDYGNVTALEVLAPGAKEPRSVVIELAIGEEHGMEHPATVQIKAVLEHPYEVMPMPRTSAAETSIQYLMSELGNHLKPRR